MYRQHTTIAHTSRRAKAAPMISRQRQQGQAFDISGWQSRATIAYQQSRPSVATLQVDLAQRIYALTGAALRPESIFVDHDMDMAVAVIDGVTFRMQRGQVVVLRSCGECGLGHFESQPIETHADLGHTLSAWEPRCSDCQDEDPINWLEN